MAFLKFFLSKINVKTLIKIMQLHPQIMHVQVTTTKDVEKMAEGTIDPFEYWAGEA